MKKKIERLEAILEKVLEELTQLKKKLKIEAKTELIKDKWYRNKKDAIFCFNGEYNDKSPCGYGINSFDNWLDADYNGWQPEGVELISDKEVEKALIIQAKKRYKKGDRFKPCNGNQDTLFEDISFSNFWSRMNFGQVIYSNYEYIYQNGKWAEIVENKLKLNGKEVTIKYSKISIGCVKDMDYDEWKIFVKILEKTGCDLSHSDIGDISLESLKNTLK